MPLKVPCTCGRTLIVPDRKAGSVIQCPKCHAKLKIPKESQLARPTEPVDATAATSPPSLPPPPPPPPIPPPPPVKSSKPPPLPRKAEAKPAAPKPDEIRPARPTEAAVQKPPPPPPPIPPPPPVKKAPEAKPVLPPPTAVMPPRKPAARAEAKATPESTPSAPAKEPPVVPAFKIESPPPPAPPPPAPPPPAPPPPAPPVVKAPAIKPAPPPPAPEPEPAPKRRGFQHDKHAVWHTYYLGLSLLAVALFGAIPGVLDVVQHFRAINSPGISRWAMALLVAAVIQIAYAIYLMQLPDWSSVWVVSVFTLMVATGYAVLLGLALLSRQDSQFIYMLQLTDHLNGGKASGWCVIMLSLTGLISYFAGRMGLRWHKEYVRGSGQWAVASGKKTAI